MNDPRAYFPFYPGDFWDSERVSLMSMEAVGLYLLMLSREWQAGSASADPRYWQRLLGSRAENFECSWDEVRPCFEERDGRLYNKRLESERAIADQQSSRQSERARGRWERWRASQNATAQPPQSAGTAKSVPGSDRSGPDRTGEERTGQEQKKPRAPRTGPHAELIRFWEAEWLATRQTAYAVEAKDGVAAAAILKLAGGDLQEAQRRASTLLHSPDAWMTQNASLPLLRSRWNQLAVVVIGGPNGREPAGFAAIRSIMERDARGGGA